jgi:hypothetical protein
MRYRHLATLISLATLLLLAGPASAQQPPGKMVVERVVPPNASLTYSVAGTPVQSVNIPAGRVRVTIEFGSPIVPRHAAHRRVQQ